MKVKFKANKNNIYKGKYEQILNMINEGWIIDFSKAQKSDNGKIRHGNRILEMDTESNKKYQIEYTIKRQKGKKKK